MNGFSKISLSAKALALPALLLGLSFAGTSQAAVTTAQAFEQCREVVEVAFGTADEVAEVRLDGTRNSGRQLRLRVFTPDGEQLKVRCNVNRKTGELVSIDPPGRPAEKQELASSN